MACHRIRSRCQQTVMGKRCKAHRTRRARCKSGPLAHRASHVSRARRVSHVFSVLRESKARQTQKARPSSRTTARPVSMAIIRPIRVRWIQRLRPMARTTSAAPVAIVAVVADVIHDQLPMADQGLMIATARANHARRTIPTPPQPQAEPAATQHSQASMANIPPTRRASPTGCSTIPATARLRLVRIPARLATQVVRWIVRRDAIAIIVKNALKARLLFASARARATA